MAARRVAATVTKPCPSMLDRHGRAPCGNTLPHGVKHKIYR